MPLFIGIHGSSTCSLVNNGGHRLQLIQQWWLPKVNGWCQSFAAHAMATTQHSSVITIVFQNIFRLEMYQNNTFLFF